MLVGLILRVIYVLHSEDNPLHEHPTLDSAYHVAWARAIAAGEEFADLGSRPFFRAPLYIWFLAGIFRYFGDSLLVARLIQCGLGAITVGLVYWVGRRAFAPLVGFIAALVASTYWVLIYFDAELLIETLIVPLDLLALGLTLGLGTKTRPGRTALAGFVWGLSAIARPTVLLFMPFVAGWLVWSRRPLSIRGLGPAALFSVGLLVPILPITAHNTWVKGDFVLITSQGGVNFWIGNNPESDGVTAIVPGTRASWWDGYYDSIAQAEQAEGRELEASEVSRHYAGRAWSFIVHEPDQSIPLLLEKLRLFWTAWAYANNEDVHFFANHFSWIPRLSIGFAVLASFGLLGVALSFRDADLFPLWGFVAVYMIGVVAFFVCSRFRVPVLPVLMIFAAHALVWSWRQWQARHLLALGASMLFVVGFGSWSTLQAPSEGVGANGYAQLGLSEAQRGNVEQAMAYLHRALEIEPNHVEALVRIGWGERALDHPERAVPFFQRALVLRPMRTDALEGLLDTLIALGRSSEAERWIEGYFQLLERQGVREQPEAPHYHLGRIRAARGDLDGAHEAFAEAMRRDPRSFRAAVALGDLARDAGRWTAAIEAYREAVGRLHRGGSEDDDLAYERLLHALMQQGRTEEACREVSAWLARKPDSSNARRVRERICDQE